MKRIIISLVCVLAIVLTSIMPALALDAQEEDIMQNIENEIPLRLHYDEEAPFGGENAVNSEGLDANDGWERWSLPIGNGYFGANVFGRTETERVQITEKTLANPYYRKDPNDGQQKSLGGLNNFSETYIDFGHTNSQVTNYSRYLDLKTAISGVTYDYNGVTYTREYFTSYPDKALVIRLDASQDGELNFVLRPTIPFEQDYAVWAGDGASKHGTVTSYLDGNNGVIELEGKMGYYDIDFLGLYRVVAKDGTVSATTTTNKYGETDGTITVSGATSCYIYVTLGTDYELTSDIFTTTDEEKPTFNTTIEDTRRKVGGYFDAIEEQLEGKSFEDAYGILKENHLADYTNLFGRVSLNLGSAEDAALTTDALLKDYQNGNYSPYLEALYFQYGRYLLIASSRKGALPANLQGVWNRYNSSAWASGYWHNINVQMNYWPAFNTNIAETFEAYVDYNKAYMPAAQANATQMIENYNPSQLNKDGGNGWVIGTDAYPFGIPASRSSGDLGLTTQIFWDYYEFTQDKELLERVILPVLLSAAQYIVKSVELDEDGNYLVSHCDSPEQHVDGEWYFTKGTTYAQSFAYLNNYNALCAAKELGINIESDAVLSADNLKVLKRVMEQLDKYDPIKVGLSGQIKEFREEEYYGDMVDEIKHRHVSQLVGLYPGNIINSNTPAWLDAAKVSLENRGDGDFGWAIAHRMELWARTKDGENSYRLLNRLLKEKTATNLWDLYTCFQIDGNFGGTAGIAEMLLQSHEGYIEPLSAIPSAWDCGSYSGLVARGNFEVGAVWQDGYARKISVKSLSGNKASVHYSGIENAKVVKESDGSVVSYNVADKDLVTFETEVGETYIITNMTKPEKPSKPENFAANRVSYGRTELTWSAAQDAVSYNVYAAVESQPDYTLIGQVEDTSFDYTPLKSNANKRHTFKVMAVNADGIEGEGAICYDNPADVNPVLEDYEAALFANGDLQITLKTTDNVLTYRLWKKAVGESEYSVVSETSYPVIIYDRYNETDEYAVSLVSRFLHTESELYEIDVKTAEEILKAPVYVSNVIEGKVFNADAAATSLVYSSSYGYDKLTDGVYYKDADGNQNVHIGRFATQNTPKVYLDGTVVLDSETTLDKMRIYDYFVDKGQTRVGEKITVYVYADGKWSVAATLADKDAVLAAQKYDSEIGLHYIEIDLAGAKAEQVRLRAENTAEESNDITIFEVTLSGYVNKNEVANIDNVLSGKTFTGDAVTLETSYATYGYDKLTDGDFGVHSGRFTLLDEPYAKVTMECDLEGSYKLYDLKLHDFEDGTGTRCKESTVEVFYDGVWTKIYDAVCLDDGGYTVLSLYGAKAQKLRLTFYNNTGEAKAISFYEIECSALAIDTGKVYLSNIIEGKSFAADAAANALLVSADYGYDKLTDGIYYKDADGNTNVHIGRFATQNTPKVYLDGTVVLDSETTLDKMRIYDYFVDAGQTRVGEKITVYAYADGEWSVAATLADKNAVLAAQKYDSEIGLNYIEIDLAGAKAEQVRLRAENTAEESNDITIFEVTLSGYINESDFANVDNVLSGKAFIGDAAANALLVGADYGYDKLTDGIYYKDADGNTNVHIGRFATQNTSKVYLDGTVVLDRKTVLHKMRIYDYFVDAGQTRVGEKITVYTCLDGEWTVAVTLADKNAVLAAQKYDSEIGLHYIEIDLAGAKAEQVRLRTENTAEESNDITIFEVTLSGYVSDDSTEEIANKSDLISAYAALPVIENGGEEYDAQMQTFFDYLIEFKLEKEVAEDYIAQMNAYNQTLLSGTHTAHNIVQFEAKAPTCTEGGWYAYEKCTLCDYSTMEEILATEHSESAEWSFNDETHWKECDNGCGDKLFEQSHVYSNDKDTTCDCGYARSIKYDYALYVVKGASSKTVEVSINRALLGDISDLAVSFTQGGNTVKVTEYEAVGARLIFTYTAQSDDALTVSVSGAGLEEKTFACDLARFNNQEGQKFAVYSELNLVDANGDGKTDVKDLVRTKKILAELEDQTVSADANGDGDVTVTDLTMLAKYIASGKKGIAANKVTFKDVDGTVLDQVLVPTGFIAVPTVLPTDKAFIGWDKELANITEDTVITAVYAENIPEGDNNLEGTIPEDWILGD